MDMNSLSHTKWECKYHIVFAPKFRRKIAYEETSYFFKTCDYDVKVKGTLLAEALHTLTDRKRDVILLSYFMEMSDAAIARKMNLVRSTVHEHRTRSLELLKQIMEENKSECEK